MNTTRLKLQAFVISGAIAGFAGGVYVLTQNGLNTDSYDAAISIKLFSMVVIGGLGSLPGAVMGAIYIRSAEFFLPPAWSLLASGFGILLLLIFLPEGLGGLIYRVRDAFLRAVAARRGILVPSLIADKRQIEDAPVVIDSALGGLSTKGQTAGHQAVEEERELEHEVLADALQRIERGDAPRRRRARPPRPRRRPRSDQREKHPQQGPLRRVQGTGRRPPPHPQQR